MNGATSLVKTMLSSDVNVCFANPGTSEMHFVAALDDHPDMRCILCLFEGGTTGAADGYFRMKGEIAATLLHLAPGFGNAWANTHNARKAESAMLNIVGDHASYHLRYDSPLKGDVKGISETISQWTRVSGNALDVAADGAAAITAARSKNGQITTLILPANTAWEEGSKPQAAGPTASPHRPRPEEIKAAAKALCQPGAAMVLGGRALHAPLSEIAGKIAAKSGCALLADCLAPRIGRGAGAVVIGTLPYVVEDLVEAHKDITTLVMCGAGRPVCFFAYPDKPNVPQRPDCALIDLCPPDMDYDWTLMALLESLHAQDTPAKTRTLDLPDLPEGEINLEKLGQALGALLPEGAIVSDESVTSGRNFTEFTQNARAHDWLKSTGGAIGGGLPLAVGAAVACPTRKVIALTGDGSAMYTLQSLWTMARENLDVTVVVFANRTYKILHGELVNVGVETAGRNAMAMFDMMNPDLDWVALAKGHGVQGERVATMDAFNAAFKKGVTGKGPYLIEVAC